MTLSVGDIRWSTAAEGPGERTAIWTQGCSIQCPACCNRELFAFAGGTTWDVDELAARAAQAADGVTLLGGEPLDQPRAVTALIDAYRRHAHDSQTVWLFTGYPWEMIAGSPELNHAAMQCDVVIAGPYRRHETPDPRAWIGSRNQTIHILSHRESLTLDSWPANTYDIEFSIENGELAINGWPLGNGPDGAVRL